MALDPSIPLQVRPVNIDMAQLSPMNTMLGAFKLRQLEQEGEINAMGLAERRGVAKILKDPENKISDPEVQGRLAGLGEYGRKTAETGARITTAATQEKTRRTALTASKTLQYRDALQNIDTREEALSWIQQQQEDPDMAGSPIANVSMMDAARKIPADPAGFSQWKQQATLGLTKYTEMNAPKFMAQDRGATGGITAMPGMGGPATTVPGSEFTKTMTPAEQRAAKDSEKRLGLEAQRLGLEGRRVLVLEQEARQKSDPVFQQTMAGARTLGEEIAKGDVKAAQALPKIISQGEEAVNLIDKMVGKQAVKDTRGKVIQAATAPHPGFQAAVGAGGLGTLGIPGVAKFIPGTDAADFQSFQNQIEGTAFLSAFEALKGGGAISEKEGEKATAARMRMKTSTSEKAYMEAAREFQEVVRKGVETARSRVPGASNSGGMPAPAAGGTNIDALLDKYK